MKRTCGILAGLGLAAALGGCQSGSTHRAFGRANFAPAPAAYKNEFGLLNVGAGDALGAAIFGQQITLAKANQFGDSQYASVVESWNEGE